MELMAFISVLFPSLVFSLFVYFVMESKKRERELLELYLTVLQKTVIDSVQSCLNLQGTQLENWLNRILAEQKQQQHGDDTFGEDENGFPIS